MAPGSSSHRLLSACVYDPCVKRRNVRPYDRRQIVNLDGSAAEDSNASRASSSSTSSNAGQLSKRRWQLDEKPAQTIADIRKQMRRLESTENPAPLKPYVGKRCSGVEPSVRDGLAHFVSAGANTQVNASARGVAVSTDCASRFAIPDPSGMSCREPDRDVHRTSHVKVSECPTFATAERNEKIAKYFSAVG